MHFKNVDHWNHALYKKVLNMFKLLNHYTSLLRHLLQLPIPIRVCEELFSPNDSNLAVVAPTHNYNVLPVCQSNFDLKLVISVSTDSVDSCNDMFMWICVFLILYCNI